MNIYIDDTLYQSEFKTQQELISAGFEFCTKHINLISSFNHQFDTEDNPEIRIYSKFFFLQKAVKELYYAGKWHCDINDTESQKLWENVRDAAGFTPGESPA